jgi:large subunit ribosomal protein L18
MIKARFLKRKRSIRSRLFGLEKRPRLCVYRSNRYVYAQIINDLACVTLVSAKGKDPMEVGKKIAEKAKSAKITTVIFDRGGFLYHGRIKKVAEAAREGGLKF